MSRLSFLTEQAKPTVFITDGLVSVPIHAVSAISLSQSFQLPPIGASLARAMVDTHADSFTLTGLLIGKARLLERLALETLAESALRGSVASVASAGMLDGLIVVTPLAIRTNMFITALGFTVSAAKVQAIDVSITLQYVPKPVTGLISMVADAAQTVAALSDPGEDLE